MNTKARNYLGCIAFSQRFGIGTVIEAWEGAFAVILLVKHCNCLCFQESKLEYKQS
jgi:hypothetical protein